MTAPKQLRGGRYTLLRTLGEGTQGETWEAVDRGLDKASLGEQWNRYVEHSGKKKAAPGEHVVAIKCFRVGKAKAWKDVELAEREARTLASLEHPALPKYVEHFEEDGVLYLVMEKIDGESLASIRAKKQTLAPGEIARMLEDIANALRYLHGRAPPIVHRDIKPGNIIRRPNGTFALVDFGAVRDKLKPSGGSTVVGTFGYMAPEQFQGRASPKSDVYGLGATALAMLTGCEPEELPHQGLAIDVASAVPGGTSGALVSVLEAMLEPDPDRRAASVDDALALLTKPRGVPKREKKGDRRRREKEEARREAHRERQEERREARKQLANRPPIFAIGRVVGRLGLLLALVTVWLTVGMAVPAVLMALSLAFGRKLRVAAVRCIGAANRAQGTIGRAMARLSVQDTAEEDEPHIRVAESAEVEAERRRIALQTEPEDDVEPEDEHEEQARRRARMRSHATPPPRRKHWGR